MNNSINDTFFELRNGIEMPAFGLGVFKIPDGEDVANVVVEAINAGYRGIDTAAIYGNEKGVGLALKKTELPRSKIFLTSKVWNADQGYKETLQAFEESLIKLGTDYLDLYLIHWPVEALFKETWAALEDIYNSGKVRAIGVSNFSVNQLERLIMNCRVLPMVNQVEFHPYLQQPELIKYCKSKGILIEAWAPIMRGKVSQIAEITEIGERYGKNEVQVVLRWNIQRGIATIPKSSSPERINSNAEIFDFELTGDEINVIDNLDKGQRFGPDPENFDF
ncbi:MAG: aldo/keto reductase [Bacteroidetes bacterium]|nr:MAG: aldo/keto reductase [Bacteroidota bacterium]